MLIRFCVVDPVVLISACATVENQSLQSIEVPISGPIFKEVSDRLEPGQIEDGTSPEAPRDFPTSRQIVFESDLSYTDGAGKRRGIDGEKSVIRIYDLSDGVPRRSIDGEMKRLRGALSARPSSIQLRERHEFLPDYPPRNAGHLVQAKVSYGDFPWGSGLFYLAQFTQGRGNYPNNSELTYLFQGVSKDGRYYVSADFRVAHPILPEDDSEFPEVDSIDDAAEEMDMKLDSPKDSSFVPGLGEIRSLIGRIKIEG